MGRCELVVGGSGLMGVWEWAGSGWKWAGGVLVGVG